MELTTPKNSVSVEKMNSLAIASLVIGILSIALVLGYLYSTAAIRYILVGLSYTDPIAAVFIFFQPPVFITQILRSLGPELVALVSIVLSVTAVISGWFARKQIKQNNSSQSMYLSVWIGIATGANAGFITIYISCTYLIPWHLLF